MVHDFLSDFSSAEHELGKGRKATSRHGGPAKAAAVKERVRADIVGGLVHDQAAADFREDLQRGTDARRAGTTTADARATAEKRFVIGESGELDVSFLGMRMREIDALGLPRIFYEDEWLFAATVLVVFEELFANFVIIAEQIQASIADPRCAEGHDIGKGAAGIQEAAGQDDDSTIGGAILEAHDEVAVGRILREHGAEAEGGGIDEGDEAGRCVQHDVGDGGFAGRTDFPLGVPDGAVGHRAEHADPVFAAVAPLNEAILGIILAFDEAEDGTFDGMSDVRSHEGVAIAPAAKFGNRLHVVLNQWPLRASRVPACKVISKVCMMPV